MEQEARELGNRLAEAITNGKPDEAVDIIKHLSEIDAEVQLFIQPKNAPPRAEPPLLPPRHVNVPKNEPPLNPNFEEIYNQLVSMGIDEDTARNTAQECNSIEQAMQKLFA